MEKFTLGSTPTHTEEDGQLHQRKIEWFIQWISFEDRRICCWDFGDAIFHKEGHVSFLKIYSVPPKVGTKIWLWNLGY